MALSGTITGSTANSSIKCKLTWSATQSIAENYSDVTVTLYYSRSDSYKTYGSWSGSITINGEKTTSSKSLTIYKSTVAAMSATTRVYHDDNGAKSIDISASGAISGTTLSSSKASGTIELDSIPRASTFDSLSCSTSYFNGEFTCRYTPKSESFYNKLDIYLKTDTNTYTGITTIKLGSKPASQQTHSFSLSSANLTKIYNNLPSTTEGILRFMLSTYPDSSYTASTKIGNMVNKDIELTIPTSIKPSMTDGTISLTPTLLVKGKNKITVAISGAQAGSGSSIKSYTFNGPGISETTTDTSVTSKSNITNVGTLTYTVTVTDNRERTTSKTATIECYDYTTPSFKSFTAYRCNSDGTADTNGGYIKYSFNINYSSVNNTNKVTVKIYYKKNTDSAWTLAANALTNSTTKSASAIIKNTSGTSIAFNANSTYYVYATVSDNYNDAIDSSTITVLGQSRILNITQDGMGVAVGKMSEKTSEYTDGLFECAFDAKFYKDITLTEPLSIENGGTGATTVEGALDNLGITNWFDKGISIPSNSDLNNYTTPGKYYVTNVATSKTITNSPTTNENYVLYVFSRTSKSILSQLAIGNAGGIFSRGQNSSGTWGEWKKNVQIDSTESAIPISKGGTGATTAANALENFGLTATATELNYVDGVTSNVQTQLNGKTSITKLWENASPTSNFTDTTNAYGGSLTDYTGVIIYFKNTSGDGSLYLSSGYIPKGQSGTLLYTTSAPKQAYRKFTVSDAGVTFQSGTISGSTSNTYCIPIIIYGCKGVG